MSVFTKGKWRERIVSMARKPAKQLQTKHSVHLYNPRANHISNTSLEEQEEEMAGKAASSAIQYEELRPKSEWIDENNANILRIYLPEFKKEQLKITYVHSLRILRVSGERQIATTNKWTRFNQTFPVSPTCDVNNIQARYADSVLTVTLPKSAERIIAPQEEAKLPPPAKKDAPSAGAQPPAVEKKDQKVVQEIGKGDSSRSAREEDDRGSLRTKMREQEEEMRRTMEEDRRKQASEELKEKKENAKGRNSLVEDKIRDSAGDDSVRQALLEREKKGSSDKQKFGREKMKKMAANAKEKVKGFNLEVSEDRQRIINIGVSVLIIAAVGAYIYCSYLSGNRNDQT